MMPWHKPQKYYLLGITLILLLLGIWFSLRRPDQTSPPKPATTAARAEPEPPQPSSREKATTAPKRRSQLPGPVSRKGTWHLAEGETGLLSYVSEQDRTNGIMLVKLTTDSEGFLILDQKRFLLKDTVLKQKDLENYMPEVLQFERFEKLSSAEATRLLQTLENTEGITFGGNGNSRMHADVPRGAMSKTTNKEGQLVSSETIRYLPRSKDAEGLHQVDVEYTTEYGPGSYR